MTHHHATTTSAPGYNYLPQLTLATKECVAGALAGMFAKTAVAPIERVKLLLQLKGATGSAYDVMKKVYKEEGVMAFWRGNTPNVLRQGSTSALNFMLMDQYKIITSLSMSSSMYTKLDENGKEVENMSKKRRSKLVSSFVSGGLAGGTATSILYPFEFLRTRLAMDTGNHANKTRKYPNGMRDVFRLTLKMNGVTGLYEGYGIALGGVVIYRALHLGGYDALKSEFVRIHVKSVGDDSAFDTDEAFVVLPFWKRFIAAQIVSLAAGTICYPIDSVRRRLMMQACIVKEERQYKGSVDCFRKVYSSEGMRGFYLGIGPNVIRSIGGALLLVAYDEFKEMLV